MRQPAALYPMPAPPTVDPEDAGIRAGVRLRDPHALAVVYQAYWPMLFRQARLILPERMDPEDAASDVFLHVVENAARYDPAYPVYTWLARICVNLCLNRRRRFGLAIVNDWLRSRPAHKAEAASALTTEARSALRAALARLSPREREAVALRYLFLLDEGEIASALRIARGAVSTAISRGLARLRKGRDARELRGWLEISGDDR